MKTLVETVTVLKPSNRMKLPIPFYPSVSAGFPSPADDYMEERLDLNKHLVKHPAATFFVRVEGVSMTGAGIFPKDILVVDRSLRAKHNDIIVAIVEGEFTVKRLVLEQGQVWLMPENTRFKPLNVSDQTFQVWGVVTYVIHNPQNK
jgi:DNA polymerase V